MELNNILANKPFSSAGIVRYILMLSHRALKDTRGQCHNIQKMGVGMSLVDVANRFWIEVLLSAGFNMCPQFFGYFSLMYALVSSCHLSHGHGL